MQQDNCRFYKLLKNKEDAMNCPKCGKDAERKEIVFTDWVTYCIPESEIWKCGCGWRSEIKDIKKSLISRVKKFLNEKLFD